MPPRRASDEHESPLIAVRSFHALKLRRDSNPSSDGVRVRLTDDQRRRLAAKGQPLTIANPLVHGLRSSSGHCGPTIRTQRELALENLGLQQQVAVWKVRQPRPQLTATDRFFWVVP